MNKVKQQIAIAKACGEDNDSIVRGLIPDYLKDLNAMHEAEKVLTEHQWDEYERLLRLVCDTCSYYEGAGKELLHAKAAQRAEALLKALNLWEDE